MANRVTCRQLGTIEVIGGIVDHVEFFHDAARTRVFRDRERDERGQLEEGESAEDDRLRSFRGQSLTPVWGARRQPISTEGMKGA